MQVRGRGIVAVKNLKIGDYVLVDTNNHYEPVYGFGHKEIETQHSYLQIGTASGAQLEISKEHMLFVEKHGAIPSSLVRLGDKVYLNNDLDQVKSIQIVSREGAYAPFTPSGTIIVNGIKASSFVALQNSPDLAIGRFSTGISHQWIARTFELPHRIWCTLITSCESEEYNPQGISTWVAVPLKIAIWYIQQDTLTMAVLSIPLLIWLCVLGLLDLVMVYAAWFASLVAAVVVWQALSRFFQERSNSKNHAVLSKLLPSSLRA